MKARLESLLLSKSGFIISISIYVYVHISMLLEVYGSQSLSLPNAVEVESEAWPVFWADASVFEAFMSRILICHR